MAKDWQRLVLAVPPRIVTLVGMGFTGSQFVPDYHQRKQLYARKDHQVWAVNHAALWYNADLCCAMDDQERDREIEPGYVEALEERGIPVLTSKAYRHEHIEFPLWDVVDDVWGGNPVPGIDNTITAALALCIHMKVEEIRCFGLDFCLADDGASLLHAYRDQQERYGNVPPWFAFHHRTIVRNRREREPGHISSAFVVGVAHARGIEIEICPGSTFLNHDRASEPFPNGYQDTKEINHQLNKRRFGALAKLEAILAT